jgi:nucleoside 2-deoxyribosyltransferase
VPSWLVLQPSGKGDIMDRITIAAWILSADTPLDKRGAVYRALYSQADVDDFRRPGEPDSGTAFGISFAVAP